MYENLVGPRFSQSPSASTDILIIFHLHSRRPSVEKICYYPIITVSWFSASTDAELATIEIIIRSLRAEAVLLANGLNRLSAVPSMVLWPQKTLGSF